MAWRAATSDEALQIRFWGVRGSMSASGPEFAEFGGHTLCVEVWCGNRLFIVDAGSGLSALGQSLGSSAPLEVDLLLSHLHLDHVMGLPFFKPAVLGEERVIRTFCGNLGGGSAAESFDRLFSPPLFPVELQQLPVRFEHHGFRAGETLSFADGARVETHPLNHPGGSTGYRFRHGGNSACYLSDLEHTDPWPDPALVAFVQGADLVVYDGMYAEAEYPCCKGWGHSTWEKGVELCRAADAKALAIVHHCPGHTDADLRAMEAELRASMPTAFMARERQTFAFSAATRTLAVAAAADTVKVPAE
jgi:phosphoribosyl 1,2-cyclic phosphodiesterase